MKTKKVKRNYLQEKIAAEGPDAREHVFRAALRYLEQCWQAEGHDGIPSQEFAAEALEGITESVLGCLRWRTDMANGWKPECLQEVPVNEEVDHGNS